MKKHSYVTPYKISSLTTCKVFPIICFLFHVVSAVPSEDSLVHTKFLSSNFEVTSIPDWYSVTDRVVSRISRVNTLPFEDEILISYGAEEVIFAENIIAIHSINAKKKRIQIFLEYKTIEAYGVLSEWEKN